MDDDKKRELKKIEKKEWRGVLIVIFAVAKILAELTTWMLGELASPACHSRSSVSYLLTCQKNS